MAEKEKKKVKKKENEEKNNEEKEKEKKEAEEERQRRFPPVDWALKACSDQHVLAALSREGRPIVVHRDRNAAKNILHLGLLSKLTFPSVSMKAFLRNVGDSGIPNPILPHERTSSPPVLYSPIKPLAL